MKPRISLDGFLQRSEVLHIASYSTLHDMSQPRHNVQVYITHLRTSRVGKREFLFQLVHSSSKLSILIKARVKKWLMARSHVRLIQFVEVSLLLHLGIVKLIWELLDLPFQIVLSALDELLEWVYLLFPVTSLEKDQVRVNTGQVHQVDQILHNLLDLRVISVWFQKRNAVRRATRESLRSR